MWINWASKQFGLIDNNPSNSRQNGDGGKLAKAFEGLPGQDLLGLSLSDLSSRFQLSGSIASPNVSFFTHFELLKSCREVCESLFLKFCSFVAFFRLLCYLVIIQWCSPGVPVYFILR